MQKLLALTFLFCAFNIFGQSPRVVQLEEVLRNGDVVLTANGNGDSSGFAVDGYLKNNTQNRININVKIENGLYLKNSGRGQNMLAIQIFLSDGGFLSDGRDYFIIVPAQGSVHVVFNSFCADFNLNIPLPTESFTVAAMPVGIAGIAYRMSRYAADAGLGKDSTRALQIALWRSLGLKREEIMRKFHFVNEQWELSEIIMFF